MLDNEIVMGIRQGIIATAARFKIDEQLRKVGGRELSPKLEGIRYEYMAAIRHGGAQWSMLNRVIQRKIHGGEAGVATGDRGVDFVTLGDDGGLGLWQAKRYAKGSRIGNDVVAKLISISVACMRGFGLPDFPRLYLILQDGTCMVPSVINADRITVVPYSTTEFEPGDIPSATAPPIIGAPPNFDEFHSEVFPRIQELIHAGRALIRVELPAGSGKSYMIERLAAEFRRGADPAVVIAPRRDIVTQFVDLFAAKGWTVYAVSGTANWPAAGILDGSTVIIATGQSTARKAPKGFKVGALFYDEAHNRTGREYAEASFIRQTTFEFSACMDGIVDVRVEHDEVVRRGLICDALLTLAVFPQDPSFDDLAAHIAAHPEHRSILACFQSQDSAREFVLAHTRQNAGLAETYVSDDDDSVGGESALDRFRSGAIRTLCVVMRVEMGVNIHRCDTVLFAEPWQSLTRSLQLASRGNRLHETKAGFYTVLCGVTEGDAKNKQLATLIETFHSMVPALRAQTLDDVDDHIEVVVGTGAVPVAPEAAPEEAPEVAPVATLGVAPNAAPSVTPEATPEIAIAAIRREIYDTYGRKLNDPVYLIRLSYSRARALLAGRDLIEYTDYIAFRTANPHPDLPEDPASTYSTVPDLFSWDDFLGRPPPPPVELLRTKIQAAVEELYACDGLESTALSSPGPELYAVLRRTEIGVSLPAIPLTSRYGWAELFAGVD